MNGSAPAISVVLPAYNAAEHLSEAIESIRAQSFTDFELIVVDDGSIDATPRLLRDFAGQDKRIRIVSRPNTGIVGALNDGITAARADLIARMDADDIAVGWRFEKQFAYMQKHPECVLLGAQVVVIDPYGMALYQSQYPLDHESIDAALMLGKGGTIRHPVAMMRREAIVKSGGYRKQYQWAEDVDLFLRLAEIGRIANLPDVLLQYRQHCGSVNRTRFQQQADLITQVVREAAARRGVQLPQNWRYEMIVPKPPPDQLKEWGWRAIKENKIRVARKHAISVLQMQPLSLDSWRLMYCAIRGR